MSIEQRVIETILKRAEEGRKKYGVTMERDDLSTLEWLIHAQEEAIDLAIYLQKLMIKQDKMRLVLEMIAEWRLPETGEFYDAEKTRPMSYSACYGSNGVRQYIIELAKEGLNESF